MSGGTAGPCGDVTGVRGAHEGGGAGTASTFACRKLAAALAAIDECRRALPSGVCPVAEVYLEGAFGNLVHARDEFRHSVAPDVGSRWRARIAAAGLTQEGEDGGRLCSTVSDDLLRPIAVSDLGADLLGSVRLRERAASFGFATLLASALAEHQWCHVATGETWSGSWSVADALVRALTRGWRVPASDHMELRGTVDRVVAEELAALGWRRLSTPALPSAP